VQVCKRYRELEELGVLLVMLINHDTRPQGSQLVHKMLQRTHISDKNCALKIPGLQDVGSCRRCIICITGHNSRVLKRKTAVLRDVAFCTVMTADSKDGECDSVQNVRCAVRYWESVGEVCLIDVLHIVDWNWGVLV
jgi:hypothetical protein